MSRPRQLARLLRALIACLAFLCAVEAPLVMAGSARDASGWVAERGSATTAPRTPAAPLRALGHTVAQRAVSGTSVSLLAAQSPTQPAPFVARAARARDGRHLYLELQTLLC
jgi:hypothetical protein